ncbi:hypothetical protein L1987_09440 [Smallanthus sonchifolius]|uniref:Uncharacterized protein n=1 Tax=Smallanthus sonchifolius TaxID=185202 RepID=A0ACB9JNG5_9ASTR|nr:hypothetical protein L1987_09440 [Smallanthus sonchifolius]
MNFSAGLDRLARTQSPFGRGCLLVNAVISDRDESSSAPKQRRALVPHPTGEAEEPCLIRRAHRVIRYAVPAARPALDAEPAPIEDRVLHHHILLRFNLMTEEAVRIDRFMDMELYQHRGFEWGLVEELGQLQRLQELIDARWTTALACDAAQYLELTVEFHTTFRYVIGQFEEPAAVSFALGRHVFEMSMPQFVVATGWYTEAEVAAQPFLQSLRGLFRRRHDQGVSDQARLELGPYISRLAERLGVFDRYPGRLLTPGPETFPYGFVELRLAGIKTMDDLPRFMEVRQGPQVPPPAGTPTDLAIQMGAPTLRQRIPHNIERPQGIQIPPFFRVPDQQQPDQPETGAKRVRMEGEGARLMRNFIAILPGKSVPIFV